MSSPTDNDRPATIVSPITTTAPTTTTSTPTMCSDSTCRSCKKCRRRLSRLDLHSVCCSCREIDCSLEIRCIECTSWTDTQIKDYVNNRMALDAERANRDSSVVKPTTTAVGEKKESESSHKSAELVNRSELREFFSDIVSEFREAQRENLLSVQRQTLMHSFSAPSKVPDMSWNTDAGGGPTHIYHSEGSGVVKRSPGAVPLSNEEPPQFPMVSTAISVTGIAGSIFSGSVLASSSPISGASDRLPQSGVSSSINLGKMLEVRDQHIYSVTQTSIVTCCSLINVSSIASIPSTVHSFSPHSFAFPFSKHDHSPYLSAPSSLPSSFSSSLPSSFLSSISFSFYSSSIPPPSVPPPSLPPATIPAFSLPSFTSFPSPLPSSLVSCAIPPSLPPISSSLIVSSASPSPLGPQFNPLPPSSLSFSTPSSLLQHHLPATTFSFNSHQPPLSSVHSHVLRFHPPSIPPSSNHSDPSLVSLPTPPSLPPTAQSPTLLPSSVSTSSSSISSHALQLATYNANVLGLSSEYRDMMIYAFKNSFDMSRHFIQVFQQHLLADFDKDHQNGDSIFLSSLKASSLSLSGFSLPLPPQSSTQPVPPSHSQPTFTQAPLTTCLPQPNVPAPVLRHSVASQLSYTIPQTTVSQSFFGAKVSQSLPMHPRISQSFSPSLASAVQASVDRSTLAFPWSHPPVSTPQPAPVPIPSTLQGFMPQPVYALPSVHHTSATPVSACQSVPISTNLPTPTFPPTLPNISQSIPNVPVLPISTQANPPAQPAPPIPESPLDRSFDSDVDPPPPPTRSADYRRMLEFIVDSFPSARGEPLPQRIAQCAFESLFPGREEPSSPLPTLALYQRVQQVMEDADKRLAKHVDSNRWDRSLLPRRKHIYCVPGFSTENPYTEVNSSLEEHLSNKVSLSRHVPMAASECQALEATFRAQAEALSHSMWVLTGLLSLIKQEGFVPSDQSLFLQLVNSLSMGLAHQANIAASGITFSTLKRRQLYHGHLHKTYSASLRKELLKAPACSSSGSLFREEDISKLLTVSDQTSSLRNSRALVDMVKIFSRSRSPHRSPSRLAGPPHRSRTPPRSPKRVRFAGTPPPPARSSSKSPSRSPRSPKQTFQK